MKSDTPLDCAVFQLSPKRSRCELFVSRDGNREKLASGLVKPFVTHLKVAEEQVAQAVQSIKLEIERHKNAETWFTKGTVERFVRYVSTPEVLEMVNTLDAEMSQLEGARRIYSQRAGDQQMDSPGGDGKGATAAADATKKELLRAIDVRLAAVRQDLTSACARASAAGFNPDTVSELKHFADQFGAHQLNEACSKYMSLCQRRPDLISPWKVAGGDDRELRSSVGSDMSIDDPTEDQAGAHLWPNHREPREAQAPEQSRPSTWQEPKGFATFASRRSDVNEGKDEEKAKKKKEEAHVPPAESPSSSTPTGLPALRLSVQDRINLFENKQKENSSGGGSGGGKPTVGKSVELRRLSSDASSSVLRRWSGASDMSIDVSGEKKDTESPLCTPSSASSVLQTKSNAVPVPVPLNDNNDNDSKKNNSEVVSFNSELQSGPRRFADVGVGLKDQADPQIRVVGGVSAAAAKAEKEVIFNDGTNWKDKSASRPQVVRNDQGSSQETSKLPVFDKDRTGGIKDQVGSEAQLRGSSDQSGIVGGKNQVASHMSSGVVATTVGDVTSDSKFSGRREDGEMKNRLVARSLSRGSHSHSRSLSGQFESGVGLKFRETSVQVEGDQSTPQHQLRYFTGEVEEAMKDSLFSSKQQMKVEDSEFHKMKYQVPQPGSREQIRKSHSKRDQIRVAYESSKLNLPGKEVSEGQDSAHLTSTAPLEQVQRVRQSKGNQGLHDELKMKADELEKLFAEHKLRVPGDQSGSVRRIDPVDAHAEHTVNSQYRRAGAVESTPQLPSRNTVLEPTASSSNVTSFDSKSLVKTVDSHNYGDDLSQSFSDLNFGDDSRGKFYEKYMKKRDAKLREEWSSNRAEKEARMKALQDSLERSRAEMKAKFSGSTDRQDSVSGAYRAEKLRSFSSNVDREQHLIESLQNEEDEDLSEFSEEKFYGQGRIFSESTFGDGASRQSRKNFPSRHISSATPRTTAGSSVSRSSAKISNSTSGRRRDNPLAQSVPNFSDLRKENTKPSSGVSKATTRSQVRSYARSKSTNESMQGIKEEKPKRSQSLRKSSANPAEFKDLSPLNSDGVVLAPLKFDMEQTDLAPYDQSPRSFLKKGNGFGPGAGGSAIRVKASVAYDTQKNEEFDELAFEVEDSLDMATEEPDEIETMAIEDGAYTNNGKVGLSQESEKSGNSGSEIGGSTRSLAQVDPVSIAEMPTAVPSSFNSVGSLQDSPVESPVSWNSRMRNPFSYPQESSDIDASMDSPIGSPASWNSHSLTQGENDAARMRKKWGSAQKPVLVANSFQNQPRKDVTKGFKRLLKFGRKNRGSESLIDWISATTSEGDDETEDGREPANRTSEDLRKSRMGFSHGHPSDDSFNESELFNEQVQSLQSSIPAPPAHFKLRDDHISGSSLKAPRSFFSLSSFRSKGSDAKPR